MKLTADTITDEQIRELWREAGAAEAARSFGHEVEYPPAGTRSICEHAAGDGYWPGWQTVIRARVRCAEIINARSGVAS